METDEEKEEEEDEEENEETRVFVSSSSAGDASATTHSDPPKNALLLMRCRSAPHNRSSALALCRFPVSPIPASESEEEEAKGVEERETESSNLSSKDEDKDSRCSSTSQRPLQQSPASLTRCKSEPAKKAEKLMEVSYSKLNGSGGGSGKGGLGIVQEEGPTTSPPPILLH